MASGNQNYYSNPAFCQQSEFYNQRQRHLSPERRQPPVGAHKPITQEVYIPRNADTPPKVGPKPKIVQRNNSIKIKIGHTNDNDDEFRIYQESQKYLDVSNGNVQQSSRKYLNGNEEYCQENVRPIVRQSKGRYAVVQVEEEEEEIEEHRPQKHRYEYIPMQEQAGYPSSPRKQMKSAMHEEEVEIVQGRVHRYAVIPPEEEDLQRKNRYALVPVSEIKPNSRYAVVPSDEIRGGRYDYISEDNHRYQEINQNRRQYIPNMTVISPQTITSPQTPRKGNPIATQKLHELLITPKKVQRSSSLNTPSKQVQTPSKLLSPQSQRRLSSPQASDPFFTPNKSPPKLISPRQQTPKAQQKLNYTLSTRQHSENKRHTAVIAPICSSPVQSVYSETTVSNRTESWMNLSMQKPPIQATLAVAAAMMVLCGGLTAGLCFYMVSVVGRMYYLDFGTISGFACLLLGLLGFRSRNCHWLPNRNYISGYIVLSAFSLLTCAGLVVLLALQPKPGSPLADVTSGAVCGISGLSLVLASAGVIASYCCKYPPPDNRVQHCAQGFTV